MAIGINLRYTIRMRRSPIPNDGRFVFVKPHPKTFWTVHKGIEQIIQRWHQDACKTGIQEEGLLSAEEAHEFIQEFGVDIEKKVSSNLRQYSEAAEQIPERGDDLSILKDRLHPYIFGAYLKAQLRVAVRRDPQLITSNNIRKLFDLIEIELDLE